MTHATTPHLEAANSGLLQDTILHHDELIARLMDTVATRYDELARNFLASLSASPSLIYGGFNES